MLVQRVGGGMEVDPEVQEVQDTELTDKTFLPQVLHSTDDLH